MVDSALAGHAGETTGAHLFPPELTGILAVMTILLGAILLVGLIGLWILVRIHRRLASEEKRPSLTTRSPG